MFFSALFVVFATAAAQAETRVLKFYNLHTKERAEVPYKSNGRYIKSGLKKINYILRDWRKNEVVEMNPRLLDLIWTVYQQAGSSDYINIICGYRNSDTNSMLRKRSSGVAKKSQHTLGNALDFYLPDVKLAKLRAVGLKLQEGGVGFYPRSGSPFVHMDVGSVRHWPRMSRGELVSLFPDGKTMHVPADGKPLPGYNQALAAYNARQDSPIQMAGGSRSGGGLLASLFGGGADEEEDNAESAAPARAATVAKRPAAPAAPPEGPSVVLASMSADSLPVPRAAPRQAPPRPDVAVAPLAPEGAPVDAAEDAQEPVGMMAMAVPTPTWRPEYTPSPTLTALAEDDTVQEGAASGMVAMSSEAHKPEGADAIADILAQQKRAGVTQETTASVVPVPSARPAHGNARAAIQQASLAYDLMPEASASDDAAQSAGIEDVQTQFGVPTKRASPIDDTPRLAMLEQTGDQQPVSIMTGRATATGKAAKPTPRDAHPAPQPIVVPVKADGDRHRVLKAHRMRSDWESTRLPAFDGRMMRSPETVYTAGFRQQGRTEDDQRFTGKAVTFLAVARFATN